MDLKNKKVVVIGMARTGLAVAEAVARLGGRAVVYDRKPASELSEAIAFCERIGAEARPGESEIDLRGADLLVPSPGVSAGSKVFADAKRLGVEVVSEIELAYRISAAPIIAVTGTNGKTTTTILIGRMLEADGRDVFIGGNVAAGEIKLPLVTAALQAGRDSVISAEVSTFQLEWISSFRPAVAALLNVTSDHLDRHSIGEYAALKARIFENQREDDIAIVNAENSISASIGGKLKSRVLRFARLSEVDEGAFVRGDELVVRLDGKENVVCSRRDIRLRGEHNVENVLAAACAAMAFGARPESIRAAVREFREVEHRLEPVATVDGVLYINNSMCTNVDAAVRSVEAVAEPQIVIAGGKDKGLEYGPFAEALKRRARHVILTGPGGDLIGEALKDIGYDRITRAESMQDAVDKASRLAEPGWAVVLTPACSSFDMFSSFEERGQAFKDAVRNLQPKESIAR